MRHTPIHYSAVIGSRVRSTQVEADRRFVMIRAGSHIAPASNARLAPLPTTTVR